MKNSKWLLAILLFTGLFQGCFRYTFTGTSLDDAIKTFTVRNIVMGTAGGPQNMTLRLTEKLKEYYQRNTKLKQRPDDGDLLLEGTIIGYELTPVSATSSDRAAMNRLTIRVEIVFQNKLDVAQNFTKEYSFYQDFQQERSLSEVEEQLVPKILDQIVLLVFNDTAAQW